jgi:hypothetical protein
MREEVHGHEVHGQAGPTELRRVRGDRRSEWGASASPECYVLWCRRPSPATVATTIHPSTPSTLSAAG